MKPERIAVVGAGAMGHGIAYAALLAGHDVALADLDTVRVSQAIERIGVLLDGAVRRGVISEAARAAATARVRAAAGTADAVRGAALVIEAVPEDLALKQRLFAELDRESPADALLATNTSALSVTAIADGCRDPGRVLGMHFFNPVHAMRLVEVIRHPRIRPAALERALAFVRQLGKEPIVVEDSPGFASSRLGVLLGLEAMRMVEAGIASVEDIDRAMELGYNHPMGPLKLSDIVGLDVRLAIAETLHRALEEPQFEPPKILRDKVARGELGQKSGKGFYTWGA